MKHADSPPYTITSPILHLVSEISAEIGRREARSGPGLTPVLRRSNRLRTIHASRRTRPRTHGTTARMAQAYRRPPAHLQLRLPITNSNSSTRSATAMDASVAFGRLLSSAAGILCSHGFRSNPSSVTARPTTTLCSPPATASATPLRSSNSCSPPSSPPCAKPQPTDQVADQLTDQVKALLACLDNATLSATEIMQRLGLSHRPTFRRNYLDPALAANLIARTHPDKPNSRLQKYRRITAADL